MSYLETKRNALLNSVGELPPLPSDYQEVEWIGNTTGNEYIETNYYPNNKTRADIEIAIMETTTVDCCPYGITDSSSNRIVQYTNLSSNKGFAFHLSFYQSSYKDTGFIVKNIVLEKFYSLQLQLASMEIIVDDNVLINGEYTFTNTMWIFRCNGRTNNGGITRFKKFDIYEDNELVRNFVPCYRKADQVIGMYDTVTQTFFTNQGTGAFTKGQDV